MYYHGIPTGIETLERHSRVANVLLLAAMVAGFFLTGMGRDLDRATVQPWVLHGWAPRGFVGSLFLHSDLEHLIGNAVFLLIFGNVICQTVGWWKYLTLFLAAGLFAGIIHVVIDGRPAVGASGAISGLCGLTLALFPFNRMEYGAGSVEKASQWELKVWHFCVLHFAWDLFGAVRGHGAFAHWAHLGGFAGGILLGLACLHFGWIQLSCYDNVSLYEKLTGKDLERVDDEIEAELDTSNL